MKNPINKSNLRRPLKGILLIILLFIASNLFISSTTQFILVNREINRIGNYYKSIGTIQPLEKDKYYINEAQKIIDGDSMIDYEDKRRVCQGIIDGLYNPDIYHYERLAYDYSHDYRTHLGDFIFTAKVEKVEKASSAETIYDGLGMTVTIEDRLAGFPNYIREGSKSKIGILARSLVTGNKIKFINDDVIDDLLTLETGKLYLFRTYLHDPHVSFTMIKPLYPDGPLYEKLDDHGYIDWNDPKWSMLKEDIEVLNQNIQSYHVTATKDMLTIPFFQESMKYYYLKEGRLINRGDDINKNYVCVINEDLARLRGVNIGDKLEIQMRNTEKGPTYLSSSKDRKDWKTYKTSEPISFEVVGIFGLKDTHRSRGREIYIPNSTLPREFGIYYNQGLSEPDIESYLYSFTLKSSEEQKAFIKKYEEPLRELGYNLYFIESNGEGFWNSAKPIKHSILINFILFTVLLLLTQTFVVYLYAEGHKLNYAMERTLGIPQKVSGLHLALPLILYGGIASIIGGFLGYDNAIDKSGKLLVDLTEISENTINSILDVRYFFIFILGLMILFITILLIKIRQFKKSSIIDLINSNGAKIKKKKMRQNFIEEVDNTDIDIKSQIELDYNSENLSIHGSKDTLRRYSIKHSLRSTVSSMLLLILAGIFVFSLLWMNYLTVRNNYLIDTAYNEIIVTGNIITNRDLTITGTKRGPISGTHIDNLLNTELLKDYKSVADMSYSDMYIERDGIERKYEIPTSFFTVIASNKPYNSNGNVQLENLYLMEGYTLEDFNKEYEVDRTDNSNPVIVDDEGSKVIPILVSEKAMKEFELELGDRILLLEEETRKTLEIYGTIVGTFTNIEMINIHEWLEQYTTISKGEPSLFIYPLSVLKAIEKTGVYYSLLELEFKPEKNRELLDRKDELKDMVANNLKDDLRNELKIWDEELTNVVEPLEKNISLLEVLYPITFILSIIIAGILTFILVLRRSVDAAILRILGVKEKEVRWNLFKENLILVLIGIIVACIIIFAISVQSHPIGLEKYAMVMGGYLLGTIVGILLGIGKVTNKKPLEMLQVKE